MMTTTNLRRKYQKMMFLIVFDDVLYVPFLLLKTNR